jgi:hypothetical protein
MSYPLETVTPSPNTLSAITIPSSTAYGSESFSGNFTHKWMMELTLINSTLEGTDGSGSDNLPRRSVFHNLGFLKINLIEY